MDACTTRLRLEVVDDSLVNEPALRTLGARGIVRPSRNALQVVLGPQAEIVAGEIREAMASGEYAALGPAVQAPAVSGQDVSISAGSDGRPLRTPRSLSSWCRLSVGPEYSDGRACGGDSFAFRAS